MAVLTMVERERVQYIVGQLKREATKGRSNKLSFCDVTVVGRT